MALDYRTYEDAAERFEWSEKWDAFTGTRSDFNITTECLATRDLDAVGARVAFDDGATQTHTLGELHRPANRFAHYLTDHGIDKGDPVAVMLEPGHELYTALFGAWKRGAVYVPLYTLFGPDAIEYRVRDCGADVLVAADRKADDIPDALDADVIYESRLLDRVAEYPDTYDATTAASDVSTLQYTSGTTGDPTGVEMRHKSITNLVVLFAFGVGIQATDRFFCTSSPAWAHGLWMGTVGPLISGTAAGAYSGKFEPGRVLEALADLEITNLTAAATALRKLVNHEGLEEYGLSLERVTTTGGQMDTDTLSRFQAHFDVPVADIYGVSEFGAIIMNYNGFEEWETKPGSIGKPLPGLDVAVLDEGGTRLPPGEIGEIAVRHQGDWLRTGDAAEVDEDGYYWHKGRIDDVIISAGYRIGPSEVEDTLLDHDAVLEAAAVASPNPERGNIVKAFVKTDHPETSALKAELKDFAKATLSKHEYPREIEFVESFPRTESDKIKRGALRARERE